MKDMAKRYAEIAAKNLLKRQHTVIFAVKIVNLDISAIQHWCPKPKNTGSQKKKLRRTDREEKIFDANKDNMRKI